MSRLKKLEGDMGKKKSSKIRIASTLRRAYIEQTEQMIRVGLG